MELQRTRTPRLVLLALLVDPELAQLLLAPRTPEPPLEPPLEPLPALELPLPQMLEPLEPLERALLQPERLPPAPRVLRAPLQAIRPRSRPMVQLRQPRPRRCPTSTN